MSKFRMTYHFLPFFSFNIITDGDINTSVIIIINNVHYYKDYHS